MNITQQLSLPDTAIPPAILNATYAGGYRIAIAFADGVRGVIDLESELWGEVFEPLKDTSFFRQFRINPSTRTLEWPNQADLAPSFLYEQARHANSTLYPLPSHHQPHPAPPL
jgi:hypothetical protein